MEYSVEGLAKLSGVSVRTLHYYDEIGLIKPLFRMKNGRRYYGTEQLLTLQEVLFFKEIGFSLQKIKAILGIKNFDKPSLLSAQKKVLLKEIKRLEKLTKSIDKTISYYKGCKMTHAEICEQFEHYQKEIKGYEKYFEKKFDKEVIEQGKETLQSMTKEDLQAYAEKSMNLTKRLVELINNNISEDSPETQSLMQEHFELLKVFNPISKETYLLSRDCLAEESEVYTFYQKLHPKLPSYCYKAMGIFAEKTFP